MAKKQLDMKSGTPMMTLKYLKSLQCLQKNYTALLNLLLHNPDHNLPGFMIKSDSSETKHITYRK